MHGSDEFRHKIGKFFLIIFFMPLFFFGLAYAVWQLWNWLLPDIFGIKQISYWQALGLFVLSHILFKGGHWFGPGHHHGHRERAHWKRRMKEKMRHKLQQKLDQIDRELRE
ncbi:hypothetical protein [Leptospira saintgironsiae]|uniref:Uncharacterized protein n=1 Tax=Leptospira saintgironsiae TaxID=2023183 RepID=A0A2M9YFN8_9LEPT|nr:hypothetical protein [Leptospira saintgironsiae]PJZ50326.1 hypothetical protein CH362_00675 [Leptospira saintgironsiae]